MFAIVMTGGKQYKVAPGDVLRVEKLAGEAGERVELSDVLVVGRDDSVTVGRPLVAGASVAAQIVEQAKARKIKVFKYKRRKKYRRMQGHRQQQTVLKVMEIVQAPIAPA